MSVTAPLRRRLSVAVALAAAAAVFLTAPGGPVRAEPGDAVGGEGGTKTLAQVLDSAGRGYLDAKATLDASKKRQLALNLQLGAAQSRLDAMLVEVGVVASASYRIGRLSTMTALLNSRSPDAFLERAETAELLAQRDDAKLRELNAARTQYLRAKARVDAEVKEQAKQVQIMRRKKNDAERALVAVGGRATGGFVSASSPIAKPAPRNSDGSWPRESCIIEDPTPASGCITPRTLHALRQAQAAGFRRYVSCFRSGGPYEHPKGRACDFSSERNSFGGHATGSARRYGNDLAAYFVRNADKLGVLYVIWYRQIWFPGSGWKSYSGSGGDPSSDHTNHVHLSLY
ncbi:MAG TPA: hypothetical protein VES42_03895 [Pilimelia sp.]|nr:hypothetical protein [Pilimelia sp.]